MTVISPADLSFDDLAELVRLADRIREAQRAYMADRGNEARGRAVGAAADAYDSYRVAASARSPA